MALQPLAEQLLLVAGSPAVLPGTVAASVAFCFDQTQAAVAPLGRCLAHQLMVLSLGPL